MSDYSTVLMDVVAAADFLKVRRSTLYSWVHQRRIPYRKHGRRVVFSRKDLEIWSQSQTVVGPLALESRDDRKAPVL